MATTIEVVEAQARLPELVALATAGEEIVLVDQGSPKVRLAPVEAPAPRIPGLRPGDVLYISDDFDEPLPEEYWLGREK